MCTKVHGDEGSRAIAKVTTSGSMIITVVFTHPMHTADD